MKRKFFTLLAVVSVFSVNTTFAKGGMFGDFLTEMQDEIESMFPYVVGIVFIVCALLNLGNFFGENRDIKKGITNMLIFVGATLVVMGLYSYLTSLSL